MDLIRKILIAIEESERGYAPHDLALDAYSEEEVGYHSYLLVQAGLAKGIDNTTMDSNSPSSTIVSLTWEGHEFVSSARSPNIWSQAKDVMLKVGDGSFQVWQSVLADVVKRSLGIS